MKIRRLIQGSALAGGAVAAISANASTDYGPATWRPACNYNTSGNGHKFHVVHDMEGYYASTIVYLQSCSVTVSIHYCCNGKQDTSSDYAEGDLTQMVAEANYCWAALCWNSHCTGTEHEGFASNPAWFTEGMYQSSSALTRHLADKFGYAKDRNHVVGHGEKSNSAWAAWAGPNLGINAYCNTHTDPGAYWDWTHYMALINGNGAERIDIFARGTDNNLYQKGWDGGAWSGWINLGAPAGGMTSDPGTVSWGPNRIDCFTRGSTGALQQKAWTGSAWSSWINLGGNIVGSPDAASWGVNRLDVFARSTGNTLAHAGWNGSTWTWQDHGAPPGGLASDPSAVSWGANTIHVFARGTDNAVWYTYFANGSWASSWISLGGAIQGAPDAASWSNGQLHVFARGTNNQLYNNYWTGSAWTGWVSLGGGIISDPGAVSPSANRMEVYAKGTDGAIWRIYYAGGWSTWSSSGTVTGGSVGGPDAASWTGN